MYSTCIHDIFTHACTYNIYASEANDTQKAYCYTLYTLSWHDVCVGYAILDNVRRFQAVPVQSMAENF